MAVHVSNRLELPYYAPNFGLPNTLLETNGLRNVDFLNINVEGKEYNLLGSIDFRAVNIKVCGIENNYQHYRIPRLMKANGYDFVAIVGDEFYVKNEPATCAG